MFYFKYILRLYLKRAKQMNYHHAWLKVYSPTDSEKRPTGRVVSCDYFNAPFRHSKNF